MVARNSQAQTPSSWLVLACVVLLLPVMAVLATPVGTSGLDGTPHDVVPTTGNLGNQPDTGFVEGDIVVQMMDGNFLTTTSFAEESLIRVKVTTAEVDLAGDGERNNRLVLLDIRGGEAATPVTFTQQSNNTPFTYSAVIITPQNPGHYRLELQLEDDDRDNVFFGDVVTVGSGSGANGDITTFADVDHLVATQTFGATDPIHLSVWDGGRPVSLVDSTITFADYQDGKSSMIMTDLAAGDALTAGGRTNLTYDLALDLDPQGLTAGGILVQGGWYTLSVTLGAQGPDVVKDWAIQIFITAPEIAGSSGNTMAIPSLVEREGTSSVTIFSQFAIQSNPLVSDLRAAFSLFSPAGDELVLISNGADGAMGSRGGVLDLTRISPGNYSASISFDPLDTDAIGKYDLEFRVTTSAGTSWRDPAVNNRQEIEVFTLIGPPGLALGATTAEPSTLDWSPLVRGSLVAAFTDAGSLEPADFSVSFQLRAGDGTIVTLANGLRDGAIGNFGGVMTVTEVTAGDFLANYSFDILSPLMPGSFDLNVSITNSYGLTTNDSFEANQGELIISGLGLPVTLVAGDLKATPGVIDRVGNGSTTITAEFTDGDDHEPGEFSVSIWIRTGGTEYQLVAGSHGDTGDFGGVLQVTRSAQGVFLAALDLTPDSRLPLATYDLSFSVLDPGGNLARDAYPANLAGLTIMSSASPPILVTGTVAATPSIIGREGVNIARLSAEFTDSDSGVGDFRVSFLIVATDGTVTWLADNVSSGSGGVLITESAPDLFLAEYSFDPTDSFPISRYDLGFAVMDEWGVRASTPYTDNRDLLEIISASQPPVISAITVTPNRVERSGSAETQILIDFADADAIQAANFTFDIELRSPRSFTVTLAEGLAAGEIGPRGGLLTVVTTGIGTYQATIPWDPAATDETGAHSLLVRVRDDAGIQTQSDHADNPAVIVVVTGTTGPTLVRGDLSAIPVLVQRGGSLATELRLEFSDPDTPATGFRLDLALKATDGSEIVLAAGLKHGETGARGATLDISSPATGTYLARLSWDPSDRDALGTYDLSATVHDDTGHSRSDGYADNQDELEVMESVSAPAADPGATLVTPGTLDPATGTVINISLEFSDPDGTASEFIVSVALVDSNGTRIDLIVGGTTGSTSTSGGDLFVVQTAQGNFIASFAWTPGNDLAPGTYAVEVTVRDADGNVLIDRADQNPAALRITTPGTSSSGDDPSSDVPWLAIVGILLLFLIAAGIGAGLLIRYLQGRKQTSHAPKPYEGPAKEDKPPPPPPQDEPASLSVEDLDPPLPPPPVYEKPPLH